MNHMYHQEKNGMLALTVGLEQDLPFALDLLTLTEALAGFGKPSGTLAECLAVGAALRRALGLPARGAPLCLRQAAFVAAIQEDPTNAFNWGVYADWLRDQPNPATQARGAAIAAWLAPSAVAAPPAPTAKPKRRRARTSA